LIIYCDDTFKGSDVTRVIIQSGQTPNMADAEARVYYMGVWGSKPPQKLTKLTEMRADYTLKCIYNLVTHLRLAILGNACIINVIIFIIAMCLQKLSTIINWGNCLILPRACYDTVQRGMEAQCLQLASPDLLPSKEVIWGLIWK